MENDINGFNALYRAQKAAMCGQWDNPTALKYSINCVSRIVALSERLRNRDWSVGSYYPFKIFEPKERDVLAIDFEGKVVMHALCDNALYPAISRRLIRDNYAVQIGRGTHDGLDRLTKALRHYYFSRKAKDVRERKARGDPLPTREEWDYANGWVLKGDFSKYFYTLQHDYCKQVCAEALEAYDAESSDFAIWLTNVIIDSTPDPGIPIGNQTSQIIALAYLNRFDHWLRDDLGLVYGRYMDDFYIIHEDKAFLQSVLAQIKERTAAIGLSLNNKTQIFPLRNGIDFLGFHTYLTESGKVVRKLRAKSIDNTRRKIKVFRRLYDAGRIDLDSINQSYMSWRGHAKHGNCHHVLNRMDELFYKTFPELKKDKEASDGSETKCAGDGQQDQVRRTLRRTHRVACAGTRA